MRVVIGYEDSHRSYAERLDTAFRWLRPGAEVSVVRAEELAGSVGRLAPTWWCATAPMK